MFGKRSILPLFILVALLLTACGGSNTAGNSTKFSGTIHIASSTWTGYALIYLANSKGIWKQHGLDVNFKDVEDPNDRFIALAAGRLEGMASTVDAFARQQSNGVAAVEVFPIDASVGGDGILAKNTIQTVADLKGKTVAYNWMQANKTEALKAIGDAVQETPADVTADLSTMKLFDLSTGKEVMGTSSSHGKIYDNVKAAADFWKAQGKIDTTVNPSDAVDPSFINSL